MSPFIVRVQHFAADVADKTSTSMDILDVIALRGAAVEFQVTEMAWMVHIHSLTSIVDDFAQEVSERNLALSLERRSRVSFILVHLFVFG